MGIIDGINGGFNSIQGVERGNRPFQADQKMYV